VLRREKLPFYLARHVEAFAAQTLIYCPFNYLLSMPIYINGY